MLYRGEETAFAVELIARNVHVNVANNPCPLNEELKWPTPSFDFAFLSSLSLSPFFFFLYGYIEGAFRVIRLSRENMLENIVKLLEI